VGPKTLTESINPQRFYSRTDGGRVLKWNRSTQVHLVNGCWNRGGGSGGDDSWKCRVMWTKQPACGCCCGVCLTWECWCWLRGQDDEDEDEPAATRPVPPRYHDSRQHGRIGEQTDKEILQNFLTGDFCVHGVSLWWHVLQLKLICSCVRYL